MDSEHKMSIWISVILLMVVASIAGSCSYVNYTDDRAIAEMVAKGADPIAAGCAINMNSSMGNSNNRASLCMGAANRASK